MLKFTENARNRIQDGLRKYQRIVIQARQRGMSERDTSDIVRAMLGDMLGFDPFFEVTAEISIRGHYSDYATLLEGQVQYLLSIKGIAITPSSAHLVRLSGASTPLYADWIVLTNADTWACYRLGVGWDRHPELVFKVTLSDPNPLEEKTDYFFLLSKEGMMQNALAIYWQETRILHPGRLTGLILSEECLNLLRREIQRSANFRVDRHILYEILTREVLKPEALAARTHEDISSPRQPHCYAYIRDPNDPLTWRLRYRNPDNTPNGEWLTLAVADLTADFRTIGIPADDVPLVKERLRQAYFELGISPEDLPPVLK